MSRRRIAVFSGGWSGEFVQEALSGIIERASEQNIDVFSFINFSVRGDAPNTNSCEDNLFRLAKIWDFDGVFLFANTFNQEWEQSYLIGEINKYDIPCMSLEYPIEGIPYISSDNYSGMYELAEHMIKCHKCRDFLYVSGPENHLEAMDRLRAFKDALTQNGIPVTDDMIAFGDWSKSRIPEMISEWVESHDRYPEAIVCANDIMAMAACNYLKDLNVAIPEEVKVTGYDRIRLAQTASPSISSVTHEWRRMGSLAMENLITIMGGGTPGKHITLRNRFIPGGSCGCPIDMASTDLYNKAGKAITLNIIDPIDLDSHFRHFYTYVRKADDEEKTHDGMAQLFENTHTLEGSEFKLCLVSNFFDIRATDDNLSVTGYSDEMRLLCYLKDGKAQPLCDMPLEDCIYESADRRNEPGFYVFLPLYSEGKTYGFAMLSGPLNAANENQYYIWTKHMGVALEQVRLNIRMSTLWNEIRRQSVTDQLTGVYNRHGCEQNIYPDMISHGMKGEECFLLLIDVDNMKMINDGFGHTSGDEALKIVAEAITSALPEGLCAARFGGDEFIVGGPAGSVLSDPGIVAEGIEKKLSGMVTKRQFSAPLTISIGCTVCCPTGINDIEKAVAAADRNMYIIKNSHHRTLPN